MKEKERARKKEKRGKDMEGPQKKGRKKEEGMWRNQKKRRYLRREEMIQRESKII